jgi:hypothetical protein
MSDREGAKVSVRPVGPADRPSGLLSSEGGHTSNAWRLVCLGLLLISARAEARGCSEVSEIVGKQRCTRFGYWDVSHSHAWVLSLGSSVDINPMIGSRFSVLAVGQQGPVRLSGIAGRDFSDRGVAIAPLAVRVTMFPRRIFYLGIEAELGSFGAPSGPAQPTSDLDANAKPLAIHSAGSSMFSLGGVVGASLPVGRFDLSVELFGGFRTIAPNLEFNNPSAATAALGGCSIDANQTQWCPGTPVSHHAVGARLEPRAGIAIRISPNVAARVLVGFDALALGAVTVSTMFELHTRSYDAFFVRPTNATAK